MTSAGLAGAALIGCGGGDDTPATTAPTKSGTTAAGTAGAAAEPKRGGTYRYLLALDPTSLDPYGNLSYTTKGFAATVYSRLFKVDTSNPTANPFDLPPTPDLAASAESADGATWTIKLKQGVKFHNVAPVNGREVTSEDVMYSWGRVSDPKSPTATLVPKDMKLEAIDNYTLKATLPGPSPTFLEFLADANALWIMPKESAGGFDPIKTPIGTGPWIFDSYAVSSKLTYKRNPDYLVKGQPYLDALETPIIPEYANGKAQFEGGNLNRLAVTSSDVLDMRKRLPKVQWVGTTNATMYFIFFSPEDQDPKGPWRDERFRQGVSMAIDRNSLLDLQYNANELSKAGLDVSKSWNNMLPVGFGKRFWLDPQSAEQGPSAKFFNYDAKEAKKLFDAVPGSSEPFTYQYTNNGYGSIWVTYAEAIGNWLKDAGLKPQTETQDYSSKYITQTFRGNFKGMVYGIETPFPEAGSYIERMFGADPANHTKYRIPEIDAINAKQKVELNPKARTQLLYDWQRINDQHMYYVPTSGGGGTSFEAYQPNVRGTRSTRPSTYGGPTEQLIYYWLDS